MIKLLFFSLITTIIVINLGANVINKEENYENFMESCQEISENEKQFKVYEDLKNNSLFKKIKKTINDNKKFNIDNIIGINKVNPGDFISKNIKLLDKKITNKEMINQKLKIMHANIALNFVTKNDRAALNLISKIKKNIPGVFVINSLNLIKFNKKFPVNISIEGDAYYLANTFQK